jgi:2-polyprenyl-3-methyl-5-hydroxy-6-metoxy-1,4-benzoquinol methylase
MGNFEQRVLRPFAGRLRYQVSRVAKLIRGRWRRRGAAPPGSKLYVGCGDDRRRGYLGCDIRPQRTVALVCRAWKVSRHCSGLAKIYSRHMLEHLTFDEANAALEDWFEALAIGGRVHLVVPNVDFHIEQWLRAQWSEATWQDRRSDARWGFAGLWGWQRQCHPAAADYNRTYWDVHKSGYNRKLITFLLERAGFSDIQVRVQDDCHLVARATKRLAKGERQVAPTLENIRADHRARYEFAAGLIPRGARVLDVACGVGYGSKILSDRSPAAEIRAADISEGAIAYAREHYQTPKVQFDVGDALELDWPAGHFDVAVSFETIEHLPDAPHFLSRLRAALRPGGLLICSVPNQDRLPFDPKRFKHHVRHYRPQEMEDLLNAAGFVVERRHTQPDAASGEIRPNWNGQFNIAVCRK